MEASYYRMSSTEKKKVMRAEALLPEDPDAEMPEPYRIWRMCRDSSDRWWPGSMANQPHLQLLEFAVCETVYNDFNSNQVTNVERIINGSQR